MVKKLNRNLAWVDGDLRLAGLDSRIIKLLSAINQSGSINQAAKQMGLSYKGAWQIIERANQLAQKALVVTATGGSRGGGTRLSEVGELLLNLFEQLEKQHSMFIKQLNENLLNDVDAFRLFQRLEIKTSAGNQIFGKIVRIIMGAVHAEIIVALPGGTEIITTVSLDVINELGLKFGLDAVLLINSVDMTLVFDYVDSMRVSARNQLIGKLMRMQHGDVNTDVTVLLPGGEILIATITERSVQSMALAVGMSVSVVFKTNAPILGILQK